MGRFGILQGFRPDNQEDLPPWGQLSLKGELSMFWKGILTGGEMKPLTSKIGVHGAKRAKK